MDLRGWLVIIDGELFLLDCNLSSDYKVTPKIRLKEYSIVYLIRQAIMPLGGGESFVFHESRVMGELHRAPYPEVLVSRIFVKEFGGEMMELDISRRSIEEAKEKYGADFSFDFFKEMGDH